jgi:hypothetical protein
VKGHSDDIKILKQIDGHCCYDWDGLPVSAWTPEYDCCMCFKKSRLGKIINLFLRIFYEHD